jgi:xanthine dehydrogenase accessory factor
MEAEMLHTLDQPARTVHRDPVDYPPVLALARWRREGQRGALLTVVGIEGTSPRPLGAQIAVSEGGDVCGYFSGGCLEDELSLVARSAVREGANMFHRYGQGSPFIDIRLPCGSGIDVYFDQSITDGLLFEMEALLLAREPFVLGTDLMTGASQVLLAGPARTREIGRRGDIFHNLVQPALQVHVYGTGYGAVQLAKLVNSLGQHVSLFASDELTTNAAAVYGLDAELISLDAANLAPADAWTATALMFHDHDRELPIFRHVLNGPSFYIGAVGSWRVQEQRLKALERDGFMPQHLARIIGPAGNVRGARSATELAVGIYSEILETARAKNLVT